MVPSYKSVVHAAIGADIITPGLLKTNYCITGTPCNVVMISRTTMPYAVSQFVQRDYSDVVDRTVHDTLINDTVMQERDVLSELCHLTKYIPLNM